jgi:hypothetical protein
MTGGWRRCAFTARHSIPLPLAVTLAIVQLCSLWLSSDFQAEEELLDQARVFKVLWLQVCLFSIHEPALVMK